MLNKEEKKELETNYEKTEENEPETEKDELMWSEDDYDTIQKITGFDEESILNDQKKGLNLFFLIIICIVCLILGIFLGYNINSQMPQNNDIVIIENNNSYFKISAAYTKINSSNEMYLYVLDKNNEETVILDLKDSRYSFQIFEDSLYVLQEKDTLNLYLYTFDINGYHRELIKEFEINYDLFNFKNNVIMLKKDEQMELYNRNGILIKKFNMSFKEIYDYSSNYLVYNDEENVILYSINSNDKEIITSNGKFLYFDNTFIFFIENEKLYKYSLNSKTKEEITPLRNNNFFIKDEDNYVFNSSNILYFLDKELKIINEFSENINELSYLNLNEIVVITENYDVKNCFVKKNKFSIINLKSKTITEKELKGCLSTKTFNELVKAK